MAGRSPACCRGRPPRHWQAPPNAVPRHRRWQIHRGPVPLAHCRAPWQPAPARSRPQLVPPYPCATFSPATQALHSKSSRRSKLPAFSLACLGQHLRRRVALLRLISQRNGVRCFTAPADALLPFAGWVPLEQLASIVGNADVRPQCGWLLHFRRPRLHAQPGLSERAVRGASPLLEEWAMQPHPRPSHPRQQAVPFVLFEAAGVTTRYSPLFNGNCRVHGAGQRAAWSAREGEQIHQVSKFEPAGSHLVTPHVYSPPYLLMNVFSLDPNRPVSGKSLV